MAGLIVGDKAPDFTLESTSGESFNLYKELEKGPVLLNFYVGDFGINCTNYLSKFIESYDRISELGVRMVPLNPDSLDSHKLFKQRLGAPFEFLFDKDKAVSKQYGAIVGPGHMVSGFTNREFFLVGKDAEILFTWKAPIPKVLPELDEIVEGIKKAL
ncbi:MAG: redoxin domain-containing protein [Candidatus Methanomethylophilaceae archaeon]|nr:redoxin domain-containing protein [Candidatus Methanomethylophilaceae archaeon]